MLKSKISWFDSLSDLLSLGIVTDLFYHSEAVYNKVDIAFLNFN